MIPACKIGQMFGGNATDTYKDSGLLGHTGIDNSCGYGTPIHSYFDEELVYKVLTKENPANDNSGFTGVFTIVDNGIEVFEFLYGHCDPCVTMGQKLTKGTLLATEANNGEVYVGQTRITLEMQKAGDHRGYHRHDQKRILKKTKSLGQGQYITAQNGGLYQDAEGYYYLIPYFFNGYNGCVNWALPLFNRNLTLGMSGYDVGCLQRFLKARGFFQGETTEFFGPKTLASVIAFQKANGITPLLGFVGPTTRGLINSILQ
jgi:hypothetical protein